MAEEKAEKPVVESFQLDHTKVKAPYVRYIDTETGPHGDVISNYDLRLTQPNKQAIPTGGLHTIEHTIAVLLRERIPGYIDCSPFGCRTGFHLLTWGTHSTEDVAKALKESLEFIAYKATWNDVPATTDCSPPRNGPSRFSRKASAPTRLSARSSDLIRCYTNPCPPCNADGGSCAYGMVGLPSVPVLVIAL